MTTALGRRIAGLIRAGGPMSVADYMALCLGDPAEGYYMRRDPFGAKGDFITAPEVSQMFGELVGVWCLMRWIEMGEPASVALVELGPGRGTLMADLLRAAGSRSAFRQALTVHLVEMSPHLKKRQSETLNGADPIWHDGVATLPDGPLIVVANEFFDALPVRQFVRTEKGWHERVVGLAGDNETLAFGLGTGLPDPSEIPPGADAAPPGSIFETCRPGAAIMTDLAGRIARHGGALLAIDYGHAKSAVGETLQAMKAHRYVDPLTEPGKADLTAHVDFETLAKAAEGAGARVEPVQTQGDFLLSLGLLERAGRLGACKDTATQETIRAAVERLAGPDQMGTLFKVLQVRDR
ncbi:hypothetical protein HDIA_3520 [Hartmannibacter diazotrophicus]|uniref:Uncharacterized protein n=1 Tax=Hartmannibacter diazotrophicus TaxID=1482074 RepID=A0A2C9DBF3_9HYPH|nr:class I SAM-dependent methyltransferase [Hartmannibacter diazotrophicus]SON57061.1 hypothetical protein HDIA_3520 [Hartmannibacter diazotrophicus]